MLLRRVIEHVKDQNWLAVFIDFLIVVVGVFIGIQVSNWNELRNERAATVDFEQRLEADLRNQLREYDAMIEYHAAVRGAASRTLERLGAGAPLDHERFLIDAFRATQYGGIIPSRSTYDEMKASGALRLVDPVLLRVVSGTFEPNEVVSRANRFVDAPYRARFRRSIDPDVQNQLSRACGDSFDEPVGEAGGYSEIQVFPSIAYDCAIDIDRAVLQAAAAALIENEAIASDLRLQIVDFDALIAMVEAQKDFVENGLAVWLDQAGD